jgi:hypothetical protein
VIAPAAIVIGEIATLALAVSVMAEGTAIGIGETVRLADAVSVIGVGTATETGETTVLPDRNDVTNPEATGVTATTTAEASADLGPAERVRNRTSSKYGWSPAASPTVSDRNRVRLK